MHSVKSRCNRTPRTTTSPPPQPAVRTIRLMQESTVIDRLYQFAFEDFRITSAPSMTWTRSTRSVSGSRS
jgi:hypothetical protein